MINPEIVCPQLERLDDDALQHLREEWEDCEEMVQLIDAEIESRPARCMFCEHELTKNGYCNHCRSFNDDHYL